jgi:Homing endonuclease associated repeat
MSTALPDRDEVLNAIRESAKTLGRPPSRSEFKSSSGMTEYQVLKHFPSWREAVRASGLEPHSTNVAIDPAVLLEDWGEFVRKVRRIPTRDQYRRDGTYSPGVFDKKFGPWSNIPAKFRAFADGKSDWADVIALLPLENARPPFPITSTAVPLLAGSTPSSVSGPRYTKLTDRPTYGNPIDFRGLRHEPVNEDGVIFLFGMVARELGYLVEAVQAGFPDCEAKRQVDAGKWQRVRIEFEFESRNFRDHGHPAEGCDLIVCWRHNWTECPQHLEVVELCSVIKSLSSSEE